MSILRRLLPLSWTVATVALSATLAARASSTDEAPDPRDHWAWRTPSSPAIPDVSDPDAEWCRDPIDRFVIRRLRAEGLRPSPEASRSTLIRRVHLDLLGLPPTPSDVERFLSDDAPDAYERMVDRALRSPRFGERWASLWLDLARYADSQGYAQDEPREIWRFRDWVIDAFNQNMPYDRFSIEQLAGDLLDDPTEDQLIATAFHRNTMTNSEGGTYDDEFRVAAVVDRVNTTMQVWMGTSMGCAQCHDHKYDPFSHVEYFQLYDFFNQTADEDQPDESPTIRTPTDAQRGQLAALEAMIGARQSRVDALLDELDPDALQRGVSQDAPPRDFVWIDDALPPEVREVGAEERGWPWVSAPDHRVGLGERSIFVMGPFFQRVAALEARHPLPVEEHDRFFFHVRAHGESPPRSLGVELHHEDGVTRVFLGDVSPFESPADGHDDVRLGPVPTDDQWTRVEFDLDTAGVPLPNRLSGIAFAHRDGGFTWFDGVGVRPAAAWTLDRRRWEALERSRVDRRTPEDLRALLSKDADERTEQERRRVDDHFVEWFFAGTRETFDPIHAAIDDLRARRAEVEASVPHTPIMRELDGDQRRASHVMMRGDFLDLGERVAADVPSVFPPLADDARRDRLGLARWLMRSDNPLTARVTVNRFWEALFGQGLVRTSEDFGTQGEPPSHPALLDWLALEFARSGWNVKALLKQIVTSATYRQSSDVTGELLRRDPGNRLLARGATFRLSAETIRDQALACAGLLDDRLGGPSVRPPKPASGLKAAFGGDTDWVASEGDDRYRRGLYTFWRRTTPYPTMMIFDATTRELCTIRRDRTNTPLQALAALNDPVFTEAAQGLARRILNHTGDDAARVDLAFRVCVSRRPTDAERDVVLELLRTARRDFRDDVTAAVAAACDPLGPLPDGVDPVEAASWTIVASALLNLDETLTRR